MNNELYHYGVLGMKWGVRRAREHAGAGRYVTRKRQLAGDKRDLKTLEKGGHLSVGLTKKRQAALDKRDKAALEKRIAENERKLNDSENKGLSNKQKTALKIGAAAAGTALATYGAYKVSKYLKSEAGRRSYESGKKFAEEHFFKKADTRDPIEFGYLYDKGRQTLGNTDKRTKKVSGSTVEAIKYLAHPERYSVDGRRYLSWD